MKNTLELIKMNKKAIIGGLAVLGAAIVGTLVYRAGANGAETPLMDEEIVYPDVDAEEEVVDVVEIEE